jgi:hypothetical protein
MDKPVVYKGNDVFTYMEKTFGKVALKVATGQAGGNTVTGIVLSSGGGKNVSVNKIIAFPNNVKGIVTSVSTDTINVSRLNGGTALPTTSTGDYLSIVTSIIADGQNFLSHYDRMSKIERYNYIQLMHRDKRWTRKDIQKFQNLGVTDYFDLDKKEQMDLLLLDMFGALWNGERGEVDVTIPGGASSYKALAMGGIYPTMVAAGSANATGVTKSTLQDAFETLAFQTDYKTEGGVRYILAQNALLYELSKTYKESQVRYTPSDKLADLNLSAFKIGDMTFVPMATELFKDVSCFPYTWQHRMFVLDTDTLAPVCMTGYQPIETGQTQNKQQGSLNDYIDWWIQGMLSIQFNNPLSSFWIDTSGIVSNWTAPQNP